MTRQPQYPCPHCGGYARIPGPPASGGNRSSVCARCGTVLPPLPFPTRAGNALSNPTPIQPGMKAMIGGKEYVAVGIIRYEERDDDETSVWHEIVLLHPDGDARYLEYDEGRWTLTEEFSPGNTGALIGAFDAADGASFPIDGITAAIKETGVCTVAGYEGQIPWPIRQGQRLKYVDLEGGSRFFSGEIAPDSGEMEWFRGRRMEDREVLTLFGLTHLLTELNRSEARRTSRSSFGCISLVLAFLAFVLCGFAGCQPGKVVASGNTTAAQIPEEGQRFGPYHLDKVNRVYRLRVSTSQLTETSVWVQGVIENSDTGPFFDVNDEFWDESGSDDDGPWHESELTASNDFRLDQPREVYVRLFADPEAAAANAPVSFQLEEGVLTAGPFIWFGAIVGIVGFVSLCVAGATRKVWEGMSKSR